jgi:hypothetical protein
MTGPRPLSRISCHRERSEAISRFKATAYGHREHGDEICQIVRIRGTLPAPVRLSIAVLRSMTRGEMFARCGDPQSEVAARRPAGWRSFLVLVLCSRPALQIRPGF